jgi:hypothetical protein
VTDSDTFDLTEQSESWYVNGLRQRNGDLPAEISYYENGNKEYVSWYVNGQCHLPSIE